MSDPVPNDDVDGVLSSIRRLVTENPDATRPDAPLATGAEGSRHAGKFILTDALRVVEPAAETSARPQVLARRGLLRDIGGVDRRAVPSSDAGSARQWTQAPAAPVVLTGPTFATPDDGRDASDSAGGVSDLIRAELARAVDEVVSASDATDGDEGQIADDSSRAWAAARAHDTQSRSPLGAEAGTEQDNPPSAVPLAMGEETLRRLVADIVRAELQGALGERITRNVRKLVRHEIDRALSSQNID